MTAGHGARAPWAAGRGVRAPVAVGLGLGLWLLAAGAAGQDDPASRIIASYEAAAPCPDREAFLAQVRSYLDPGERPLLPPPFRVSFRPVAGGFLGALHTPKGQLSREIQAPVCHEAALAVAYVVALSISPNAAPGKGPPVAPSPSSQASSSSSPVTPASTPAASASSSSPTPSASSSPLVPGSSSASALSPVPPASSSSSPPVLGGAGEGSKNTSSGAAGAGSWVHGGVRLAQGGAPGWALLGWISFARSLGWGRLGLGGAVGSWEGEREGATLRLRQVTLAPEGCAVAAWEGVSLAGCALLRVGALRGEVSGVPGASAATALVLAPGLQGRAEVRVAGPVWFGVRGGATIPLVRPGFLLIGPDRELFRVPAWLPEVGLSLGVHFL